MRRTRKKYFFDILTRCEKIRAAWGICDGLILFEKKGDDGVYLGTKNHYKIHGYYTGKLTQLTTHNNIIVIDLIIKILQAANNPESAEDLQKCFEIMNKWEG